MKTAIVVLSDPKAGDEALGRLFNALAAAYDFKARQHEVKLLFQGVGTRWTELLVREEHPAHALYEAVKDTVAGASLACCDVFGAREAAERSGFDLIASNKVPGTPGLQSVAQYATDGYSVLTF